MSLTPPPPANPGQPALAASGGTVADYVIRSRNLLHLLPDQPGRRLRRPEEADHHRQPDRHPGRRPGRQRPRSRSTPRPPGSGRGLPPVRSRRRGQQDREPRPAASTGSPAAIATQQRHGRGVRGRHQPGPVHLLPDQPGRGLRRPEEADHHRQPDRQPGRRPGRQRHDLRLRQDHRRRREGRLAERRRRRGDQERATSAATWPAARPRSSPASTRSPCTRSARTGSCTASSSASPAPGSPARPS